MRFLSTVVAFAVLTVANLGCGRRGNEPVGRQLPPSERVVLRAGYIPVLSGLPFFVALDAELLDHAGFDVSVQRLKTSDLVVQAASNGEIDLIGIAGTSQALQLLQDDPGALQILGIAYSATCLIVPPEVSQQPLAALFRGKEIGTFPGSVFSAYTREVLRAEGVPVETVTLTPLAPALQVAALSKREVAAVYTLEPTCAEAVASGAGKYLTKEDLFSKNFLGGKPFPGGVVAVRTDFLRKHAGARSRLLGALESAKKRIDAKGFDQTPFLLNHTTLSHSAFSQLKYEGAAFGAEIDRATLDTLSELLVSWGLLRQGVSLDAAFAP